MPQATDRTDTIRLALLRVAIGLAQGLSLWALDRWGSGLARPAFAALQLLALLGPVAALAAVGVLRGRWLWAWLGGAGAILLGLGAYDGFVGWMTRAQSLRTEDMWPRPVVIASAAAAAFIAYQLALAAQRAGSVRRAPYESYFDEAWKDGVRLGLGVAFVAALWILLYLGSALFDLIGLKAIAELIRKAWFAWPATTTFFAIAAHITDTRAGLVKGARTLALTLLSWLMPLMTLIAAGFVTALLFTGLAPLWKTGHAGAILLAATAALIVLINATYQDGEREGFPPAVLKWAVRIAAALLTPLTLMAAYGVFLRIGQYGLTPERIYSLACLVVASAYAGGYLWATLSGGPWMQRLERVNVAAAYLVVAVVLTVFSPLVDPARLSVASQMARLERGAIKLDAFDFGFLRWRSGRWGKAALERLADGPQGPARERARALLAVKNRYEPPKIGAAERRARIAPVGAALPESFLTQAWPVQGEPSRPCNKPCVGMTLDVDGDGKAEVVVFNDYSGAVYAERGGTWALAGAFVDNNCAKGEARAALRAGPIQFTKRATVDVRVGDLQYQYLPQQHCRPGDAGGSSDEVVDVALIPPPK